MRGFNRAKTQQICRSKIKSLVRLLQNFQLWYYFARNVFFTFYRVLSRELPAGIDKLNVRAGAWKSSRSESRNSKSNKFVVTVSARH